MSIFFMIAIMVYFYLYLHMLYVTYREEGILVLLVTIFFPLIFLWVLYRNWYELRGNFLGQVICIIAMVAMGGMDGMP